MKAEFIAATVAEQEYTGGPVEICAVLNRLPPELLNGPDDQVIDEVDALMDDLYRQGELVCPGHRWLSGPPPSSIRDHLVRLHARGNVHRDAATGEWRWVELTVLRQARQAGRSKRPALRRPSVPIQAETSRSRSEIALRPWPGREKAARRRQGPPGRPTLSIILRMRDPTSCDVHRPAGARCCA